MNAQRMRQVTALWWAIDAAWRDETGAPAGEWSHKLDIDTGAIVSERHQTDR